MGMIDYKARAEAKRDKLVAIRRDLHQHPELAFEEVRTAGIVAAELGALGLEVQTGVGKTGVIGMLEGEQDGPTVLVRADMDALPILEANQVEYASKTSGKMHACGHDGHTTIALGVAQLLSQHRAQLRGRVKFVFQPAEEVGQGAQAMVDDGALRDPRPDISLGLHLWNEMPLGMLGVADGPVMAASSDLTIRITGKGGHGALPEMSLDPVVCAAQIVTALQTIVSRNVPALDSAVISVTQIHTGTAHNIIPQTAELNGTFRTFRREIRDLIEERIREIATGIAAAMGCTAEVTIRHFTEAVANHPEVSERVRGAFRRLGHPESNFFYERTMGSEDVGLFMDDIPGMYFFVGSANAERGLNFGHHHPRFDFDEDVLPLAVSLLSAAIGAYVLPEAQG